MSMKLKSISKYKDGDKSIKVKETKPSFADKIKPLTPEQKEKGNQINELAKKKTLFDGGVKEITGRKGGSKPVVKETVITSKGTPGTRGTLGSARIKEETMQKNKLTGKVELKEGFKDSGNKDRVGQEDLRQKALNDSNKNIANLKHGDKITYIGSNGKLQHAGTVEKIDPKPGTPPTPPKKATVEKMRLTTPNTNTSSRYGGDGKMITDSHGVKSNSERQIAAGKHYMNGQWMTNKKSDLQTKEEIKKRPLNANKAVVDDPETQKKLVKPTFKKGTSKMKLLKKGC